MLLDDASGLAERARTAGVDTFLGIALMTAFPITVAMAQQAAAPSTQPQVLVGSDSLIGTTVRNNEGHDVGKVSRLMIDPNDGRVASVVISTGGALGVGSSTISVPWNSVKIGQDRGKVIVTTSQSLEQAPKAEQQTGRKEASMPAEQQPRRQ